jgi:hypothetical protein
VSIHLPLAGLNIPEQLKGHSPDLALLKAQVAPARQEVVMRAARFEPQSLF